MIPGAAPVQAGELDVLFRDEHLVAVHKPAGLLVHRTGLDRHETRFAVQLLRDQLGQRVYPAHRLDRGTSGLLLFAFSPPMAARLGAQFAAGTVGKRYLAVVRGHPPEAGAIDHPLSRQSDDDDFSPEAAGGAPRPARTLFRRLASCELPWRVDRYPSSRYALLELEPLTGRRHQLRRHLKHLAHPVIGDATHGKGRHNRMFQEHFGCARLLLACVEMSLEHPASGAPLTLTAPLAEDFARVVERLGWRAAVPARWWPAA